MIGDRRKGIFGALLLVALFAAVFYASWLYLKPKPPAPGNFGAIALSPETGSYGAAWGFHDPAAAQRRSLQECSNSGGSNCVIKASLNGTCGSLVTSVQGHLSYVVTDADKYQATAWGLAQCQATGAGDCAVHGEFCASGG